MAEYVFSLFLPAFGKMSSGRNTKPNLLYRELHLINHHFRLKYLIPYKLLLTDPLWFAYIFMGIAEYRLRKHHQPKTN